MLTAAQVENAPVPPADASRRRIEDLLGEQLFAAAEAHLTAHLASFPQDDGQPWVVRARLLLAKARGDLDAVMGLADWLRIHAPTDPLGYWAPAAMLRAAARPAEAEILLSLGLARLPNSAPVWIEAASNAMVARQDDLALSRWQEVRARVPDAPIGYINGATVLTRLGASDRAYTLLSEGLARIPADRALLAAAARHACRMLHWQDAERLWTRLLQLHPDDPSLAVEAARAMFGRRFDRETRRPFMLHHLALAQQRFPTYAPAFLLQIEILRDAGRIDAASAFGQTCAARFPADPSIAIACATLEGERGRPADGMRMLDAVRPLCPPNLALEAAAVRLMRQAGDLEAAERACSAALAPFADGDALTQSAEGAALIEQHITLATRRGDLDEAARRCRHWNARFPGDPAIRSVIERLSVLVPEAAPPASRTTGPDAAARLFSRFESLGATAFGCEFGMVQRGSGADPIGLLRWANISMDGLARAVADGLTGFGDPDHTIIETRAAEHGQREYVLLDRRYGYLAHTFIRASEAPQDRVYQQAQRRLRFLAAKLLEDLAQAEKIFVFKAPDFAPDAGGIAALSLLFATMRLRGPCTLVCVIVGDAQHAGGTVEMIEPGLFLGRVSMFTDAGITALRGVDLDGWRSVCEAVVRWQETPRYRRITPSEGTKP